MKITVYCGATPGNDPSFMQEAHALGAWMAHECHVLVWGCGDTGLMGAVSDGVLDAGGNAIGVIPHFLQETEAPCPHNYNGRLVKEIVDDMPTRRNRMLELGEAFVALPGGMGTLDEISEAIALAKFDMLKRPLIVMNAHGCYDALLQAFADMVEQGFMAHELLDRISVATNAAEVAALLS